MDVKEFFYNGGCVQCVDRSESDVVIDICRQVGLPVFPAHDPNGIHHGVYWNPLSEEIGFQENGSPRWSLGTPFAEWMEQCVRVAKPTPVEDLI